MRLQRFHYSRTSNQFPHAETIALKKRFAVLQLQSLSFLFRPKHSHRWASAACFARRIITQLLETLSKQACSDKSYLWIQSFDSSENTQQLETGPLVCISEFISKDDGSPTVWLSSPGLHKWTVWAWILSIVCVLLMLLLLGNTAATKREKLRSLDSECCHKKGLSVKKILSQDVLWR